jgi:hypothetical protein
MELPKGVTIRHHPKRAAAGHLPWGVHIELMVKGERIRSAEFYATQDEAVASAAGAVIAAQQLRDAAKARATAAAMPAPEAPVTNFALPVPTVVEDFPELLGAAADLWIKHVRRHNESATRRSYDHGLKFITPRIGAWPLAAITSSSCLTFYDDLAKAGMPLKARRRVHACLSALFSWVRVQVRGRNYQPSLPTTNSASDHDCWKCLYLGVLLEPALGLEPRTC